MINSAQTVWPSDKNILHCVLLLSLLLSLSAGAQTASSFYLKAGATLAQTGGLPLFDRTGECIAWRTSLGLTVLNPEGNATTKISGTFLKHWVSSNGNAVAVLEKVSSAKDDSDESALILRWFDRDGRQMGSYNFPQHSDESLPHISFNATGSHLIIAQPATARLIVLNNNGQTLREVSIFPTAPYLLERPFFMAASAEAFVVLSQSMPSTSTETVAPICIRFTTSGEEEWRRELPAGTAGGLAISDEGELIVASRYLVHVTENGSRVESTISLLQRDGKLLANVDGLFRRAVFAQDNTRLLLMDRRQLRALEVPSGNVLWQINLSRRAEMFLDIAANAKQDKVFALVGLNVFKGNRFVFENAHLLGFDNKGQQQFEMPVKIALSSPALMISADEQRLALAAEGLLQTFGLLDTTK